MNHSTFVADSENLPTVRYSHESELRRPDKLLTAIFQDLWKFRELSWVLFTRDLKAQYRQSYLGYFWLFAPVVATTVIWFFLNSSQVVDIRETSIPYPAYVLVGSLIWTVFAASVHQPLLSFNAAQSVLSKLRVPPETFILSGVGKILFEMLIRLLILVPVFLLLKIPLAVTAPLFFVGLACTILTGLSIGLLLVPVGALYTDVSRIIEVGLGFGMYLAPVIYPPPVSGFASRLVNLNPATPLVVVTRDWLTQGHSPYVSQMMLISIAGSLVLVFGLIVFRIALPRLIERQGM